LVPRPLTSEVSHSKRTTICYLDRSVASGETCSVGSGSNRTRFVSGHDFSRAVNGLRISRALAPDPLDTAPPKKTLSSRPERSAVERTAFCFIEANLAGRARLQPCRKELQSAGAFSPWGTLFSLLNGTPEWPIQALFWLESASSTGRVAQVSPLRPGIVQLSWQVGSSLRKRPGRSRSPRSREYKFPPPASAFRTSCSYREDLNRK
jgi:hypothetical protein